MQVTISDMINLVVGIPGLLQPLSNFLHCRGIGKSFRAGSDAIEIASDAGGMDSSYFNNML